MEMKKTSAWTQRVELNLPRQLLIDLLELADEADTTLEGAIGIVWSEAKAVAEKELRKNRVEEAIRRAEALSPGTRFTLNKVKAGSARLFTPEEWEEVDSPIGLGIALAKAIEDGRLRAAPVPEDESGRKGSKLYVRL